MTKPVLIQIVLLAVQAALYFGIQPFEGSPHEVYAKADAKIPFVPAMIFFYILWFPLIALFPLLLYRCCYTLYLQHMTALVLDIVISCTIYLIYPTSFSRPAPEQTAFGNLMRFVYKADFKGKNCMPSMHCSMCFLMIFSSAAAVSDISLALAGSVITLCILIIGSTVLTKQHVIVDVITGFAAAVICRVLAMPLADFMF